MIKYTDHRHNNLLRTCAELTYMIRYPFHLPKSTTLASQLSIRDMLNIGTYNMEIGHEPKPRNIDITHKTDATHSISIYVFNNDVNVMIHVHNAY